MKQLLLFTLITVMFASLSFAQEADLNNKEKAIALLNSLQSGDTSVATSIINPDTYIQHNLNVPDGIDSFIGFVEALQAGEPKVNVIRAYEDGDFVFLHTEYDLFGHQAAFDIFRFEDGFIVEHWDGLQDIVAETASGRTQLDGPIEATDLDKTEENKALVTAFVEDILKGANPEKITDYISTETYYQHNPMVADGLAGLGEAIQAMTDAGTPMVYTENHMVLGEGNFVLTLSEGQALGNHVAFFDLFRVENGLIVEHWDTVEAIPAREEWKNDNGKF